MTQCDDCAALLREALERLERIERRLEGRRCTPADIEQLERLLPAIAGAFGSAPTTTAELRGVTGIRAVGPSSSRAFGALLSKAAFDQAVTSGGLAVVVAGREANKILFSIVRGLPPADDKRPGRGV
jgi:hypothetical protein